MLFDLHGSTVPITSLFLRTKAENVFEEHHDN
jgi:hypothetical protein